MHKLEHNSTKQETTTSMMYSLRFQFLRDTKPKSNINLENMQIVSHIITEKKCKPQHIQPNFELLRINVCINKL